MSDSSDEKTSKKRKLPVSTKTIFKLIVVLVLAGIVIWAYYAGISHGKAEQKKKDATSFASPVHPLPPSLQNHWVLLGTIEKISSSSLQVKDIRGENQDMSLTKSTIILDKTDNTTNTGALKTGIRIIASGTKDKSGNYTVTRIRIEQ